MGLFGKLFEKKSAISVAVISDCSVIENLRMAIAVRNVQQNFHRGLMNADKVQWLILKNRLSIAKKIK